MARDIGAPAPLRLAQGRHHHYLRYLKSGDSNTPIDIWTREIRFEKNGPSSLCRSGRSGRSGMRPTRDRGAGLQHEKGLVGRFARTHLQLRTDIEFLQARPLAAGFEASINFYHPGGRTAPQRYLFKVTGSATIPGPAGPVDCWVVTTDYNRPGSVSTFWFAQATQLMVRHESPLGDGRVMVKALID